MNTTTHTTRALAASALVATVTLTGCSSATQDDKPTTVVTVTRGQETPTPTANTNADDTNSSSDAGQALPTATPADNADTGAGAGGSQGAPLPDRPQMDGSARIVDATNFSNRTSEWFLTDPTRTILCATDYKPGNTITALVCERLDNKTWANHTDKDLCGDKPGEDANPNRISTRTGGYCLTTADEPGRLLSIVGGIDNATTLNAGEQVIFPNGISFVATNDGLYFGGGAFEGAINADNVYLPIYSG